MGRLCIRARNQTCGIVCGQRFRVSSQFSPSIREVGWGQLKPETGGPSNFGEVSLRQIAQISPRLVRHELAT